MKRTLFRITMLILLGLTFFAIFNFSSQDGQTSSGLSRKVARKIVDIFPYTKNLSEKTKNKIVEKSQPIIRKGAHFSIYMLVGILIILVPIIMYLIINNDIKDFIDAYIIMNMK